MNRLLIALCLVFLNFTPLHAEDSHWKLLAHETLRHSLTVPHQDTLVKTIHPSKQYTTLNNEPLPDDVSKLPLLPKLHVTRIAPCGIRNIYKKMGKDKLALSINRSSCEVVWVYLRDLNKSQIGFTRNALGAFYLFSSAGPATLKNSSQSSWPQKSDLKMNLQVVFGAPTRSGREVVQGRFGKIWSEEKLDWSKLGLYVSLSYSRKGKEDGWDIKASNYGKASYRPFRHGRVSGIQLEFDYQEKLYSNTTARGRMTIRAITHDGKKLRYPRFQVGHIESEKDGVKLSNDEFKKKLSNLDMWDWRNLTYDLPKLRPRKKR